MPKRLTTFPEVPTLIELGYDVQVPVWIALGTVAGTPPSVIARLNKSLIQAIQAPEFSGKMTEVGVVLTPSSSQEAEAFAQKQLAGLGTDPQAAKYQIGLSVANRSVRAPSPSFAMHLT